jgi:hypothetical protein
MLDFFSSEAVKAAENVSKQANNFQHSMLKLQ